MFDSSKDHEFHLFGSYGKYLFSILNRFSKRQGKLSLVQSVRIILSKNGKVDDNSFCTKCTIRKSGHRIEKKKINTILKRMHSLFHSKYKIYYNNFRKKKKKLRYFKFYFLYSFD